MGFSIPVRSSTRLGLLVLTFGGVCIGFLYSLSVMDYLHLGFTMFLQSFAYPESVVLALNYCVVEPPSLLQSFARSDLPLPICDASHVGFPMSLHSFGRSGSASLAFGLTCIGLVFSSLVLDTSSLDLSPLLRGPSRFELAVLVLDPLHLDPGPPLRAFAHLGFLLLVMDPAHTGFSIFVQSFAHVGPVVSTSGLARAGFVSFLFVFDATCLGPVPLVQSLS